MFPTAHQSVALRDCGNEIEGGRTDDEEKDERRRARLEAAWRQNVKELYSRSLRWTSGHREDAEDALGQAALIALNRMPQELQPDEERRWLLRLVHSKCMDIHRHRKRSRFVVRDVDGTSAEEEIQEVGPGLESVLLESELIAVTRDRIQTLPPRLRSVAELHLLRDMSYTEIADLLALTEVNVRKRMQNARALLREHLQAYLEGDVHIQALRSPDEAGVDAAIDELEPLQISGMALETLEKYVQRHPRSWKKRWELAFRLREAGFPERAVSHFREATSRQPRRMDLWSDLGLTLLLLGRGEEAREAFEAALSRARDEVSRVRLRELIARSREAAAGPQD